MANTTPTPISFAKAVALCLLLLFKPQKFREAELADNEERNAVAGSTERLPAANVVRHAFVYGFLLVAASAFAGGGLGLMWQILLNCFTPKAVMWLQIAGTCLLLWGTLFVRGWDIQTHGGVTYSERVNQWLYRFLYCAGTALLVCSLVGMPCTR